MIINSINKSSINNGIKVFNNSIFSHASCWLYWWILSSYSITRTNRGSHWSCTIILAFLTWLGTGTDFLGLLREWYKENREKSKIPIFEPKGFYKNSQNVYFLRIEKVKGEDIGEEALGYILLRVLLTFRVYLLYGNLMH